MARILLIEEELHAAEIASVICREDGHDCATVASLDTALERVEGEAFDLVILDHSQPQAIVQDVVTVFRSRNLPVVLLAPLSEAERRKLERAGVARVLPKPFSIQMLQTTLRQILQGRSQRSGQQV